MPWTELGWWAVAFLAVFLIGLTKSGFGSGTGLLVVPMMALSLGHTSHGAEAALGLLLPLLIIGDLLAVWQYRWIFSGRSGAGAGTTDTSGPTPRQALLRLAAGTLTGVLLGSWLLWWFDRQKDMVGALMRIEIGLESILLVGLHWWRMCRGMQQRLMPEPWRSHITGTFAGASSTLAHAAGPIIAMYLLPLRMERQRFVGTCAVYFFMLNSAKLPGYWVAGQFNHVSPVFAMKFLPLVLAGAIFGRWLNKRISDKVFSTVVYAATFALGWYILWDGSATLLRHWQ